MRKYITAVIFILTLSGLKAQNSSLKEPDFIGEGVIVNSDQTITPLEKLKVNVETRMYFSAVGLNIVVEGCCAKSTASKGEIKLLIKVVDNSISPSSNLEIFKLNSKSSSRMIEYLKLGNYGRMKEGVKMETLQISGSKFGTSSYLITLKDVQPGEYGIVLESEKKTIGGGGQLRNVIGPTSILCFGVK